MLCVAGRLVYSWKSVTFIWFDLQRKAFEEDRATWLKHQFLNLSPFAESKKPQMSKSKSAFLICKCVLFYIVLSQFTIVLIMLSSKVDCWMLIENNKLNDKNTYRLSKYWLICWSHSFILQLWCSYSISVYWNSFSLLVVFILFITKNKSLSWRWSIKFHLTFAAETKASAALAPEKLIKCTSDTTSPTPRCVPLTSPPTADLCRTLCLIPEIRYNVFFCTVICELIK